MEENKKKVKMGDDFLDILDSVISKGKLEKEFEITPEFKVTLRVLDTWETITAEALSPFKIDESSEDIVYKTRHMNKIIRSIIAINGKPIENGDDENDSLGNERRVALYQKIGKLPTSLIDKIMKSYADLCKEQEEVFSKVDENVENF